MQRRVERADGDRVAVHLLEEAGEVRALHGQQLLERAGVVGDGLAVLLLDLRELLADLARPGRPWPPRAAPSAAASGRGRAGRGPRTGSSSPRSGSRSSAKNMCSVRQRPMPRAPKAKATLASRGMSALARMPSRRTSSAQPSSFSNFCVERRLRGLQRARHDLQDLGRARRQLLQDHLAGGAVDGDAVAFLQGLAADLQRLRLGVDLERAAADHRRLAHLAADHGGVRRHARRWR